MSDEPYFCIGCGRPCDLVTYNDFLVRLRAWQAAGERVKRSEHAWHAHWRCPGKWCNCNAAASVYMCGPDRPGLVRPSDLPGWDEAMRKALEKRTYPEEAFLLGGDKLVDPDVLQLPLTPEKVARFCRRAYDRATPDEQTMYCTHHAHCLSLCPRPDPRIVRDPFETVTVARAELRPPPSNLLL